jgi:methylenetetrahydrofolate reductase (NADPH)
VWYGPNLQAFAVYLMVVHFVPAHRCVELLESLTGAAPSVADVPTGVPLTVTVTEARGMDATADLTERLLGHGYSVAPHLAARRFVAVNQVEDVVGRLREAGGGSVFVIGGDMPRPAGRFADAFSLLDAIHVPGQPFEEASAATRRAMPPSRGRRWTALKRKAPLATQIITQICFDAGTTAGWAAGIASAGIEIPVRVGMLGPVNRQARRLGVAVPKVASNIRGLHIFTFNELRGTERWRRLLAEQSRLSGINAVVAFRGQSGCRGDCGWVSSRSPEVPLVGSGLLATGGWRRRCGLGRLGR